MRSAKRLQRLMMAAGAGALVLTAVPTWAGSPPPPAKKMYLKNCSACHGESGKGDGVVSGLMNPRPTDLTQLAKKNGGSFPYMEVFQVIDGRQTVRGHGDPDMPVWGDIFTSDAPESLNDQAVVRGRVMLITEYLESIQAK